ncbi:MAG: DNA polymerase III subunit delta [Tenericutes bacterium]|nr:DNA polymerase III subunit delta [Mycoplasmatota bacterium]
MIYVLLGNEVNIIRRKVDSIINKSKIENIIKYDFELTDFTNILEEVNYVDLFNEKKLIIVSSFSFKKLKDKDEKELIKYIDNMDENVIIIKCTDSKLDDRKNIIKKLREKCKVEEIKKLGYKDLEIYVNDIFKENKKIINSYQIKKILSLCEYNDDFVINEVDKLLLYKADEEEITDADIDDVISKNPEKEIFKLTDNVMKKSISSVFESYKVLLSSGVDSIFILDNLSKQFRTLYQVKLLSETMNLQDISKKLELNPYVVKVASSNINNYNYDEIIDIMYRLSDADINIKVNGLDKNKVLETLFLSL